MIQRNFRGLLAEAIRDFAENGYRTEAQLQDWLTRLHAALELEIPSDDATRRELSRILGSVFKRDVFGRGLLKRVPGVSRYTLDRIAPSLRAELDRRIFAGVDLIRLNKRKVTQQTLQRFAGWVSSVPTGGAPQTNLTDLRRQLAKPVSQLRYEARRVAIDQSAKMVSAISHVAAMQAGAIAAYWNDRGTHDKGYDARPDHLARSGRLYLVRDSWAANDGLVRRGGPYTDEVTQPAEEVYCQCSWTWVTSPRALPEDLLTAKGRGFVKGVVAV